jgi:hypothetical protein
MPVMDRVRHVTILLFPRSPLGAGQASAAEISRKSLPDNRTRPI